MTEVVTLTVPGDKSLSHRALMFAALASGRSSIRGLLPSADVRSTAGVLRALGVTIDHEWSGHRAVMIDGVGRRGLRAPSADLDCGNSGTTARLMSGIISGHPLQATLIGDASLSRRPMRRIARPLTQMGATFTFGGDDGLPMTVHGGALTGIDWISPTASAQVKSAILFAGLVAGVRVSVQEPVRSRDHTERMLAALGAHVSVQDDTVTLLPTATIAPLDVSVPGDPSSAVFLIAAAALAGVRLIISNVGVNPTRTGAFAVLQRMGVPLALDNERLVSGEPVADVVVGRVATLVGTDISGAEIPALIDEIPMLACLAACAEGITRITDASELRVKESDRIATVVSNLRRIGASADELPDGLVVQGGVTTLAGPVITHADHRIAMAFGVLNAQDGNSIEIDDAECVDVSFPDFWRVMHSIRAAA
jgi:3-phosphoshikimate 1-carboxyvinyltransferase